MVHRNPWLSLAVYSVCWCVGGFKGGAEETLPPSDPVAGRSHWAFQPLSNLAPVHRSSWATSSIDRYIFDQLNDAGLRPSGDAAPRDLVRRLYVQLTGLPPTIDQVDEYLSSVNADATGRLVDSLIHSPHFGERWGRHWLDLARYADSNGLDENFLFREAWRYRNWVIDAVNSDVGYDRFLLEQIAGDLLPYETIEQRDRQRIASGFLVVGPKVLLGVNTERQRMDVADEQLDTIGRAVLGMTVGCARCHDHKFDPIPTADYYALAGILTSTQVMEQRYMLGQQRRMERLVGLGVEGAARDAAYEKYWRELPKVKQAKTRAESVLEFLEKDDEAGLKEYLMKHPEALAEGAKESKVERNQRIEIQKAAVASFQAIIKNPPPIPPRAMIASDIDQPRDEAIRRSGVFDRKGAVVPRGFLQVVSSSHSAKGTLDVKGESGRQELGEWLTDEHRGAGHLAARVMANRIWYHLMGSGLVNTVDNFGRTGVVPSHPELLDYLARRLIESGWSVKGLVREIALSRTFRQSAAYDEEGFEKDPGNRLYWRANRRRLEPEVLRDSMLLVSGELDRNPMKSSVWYLGDQATAVGANKNRRRTNFYARSLYLPMIRNDLPELFDAFDFSDPHATTGARPKTLAPSRALFILNDELVTELAEKTVRKHWDNGSSAEERFKGLFKSVLGVKPSEEEQTRFLAFIRSAEQRLRAEGAEDPERSAWALACQSIFAMSRFQLLN